MSADCPEVGDRSFAALRMTERGGVILSAAKDLCARASSRLTHVALRTSGPVRAIVPCMLRLRRKWSFYTRFVCCACATAHAKHTKRVLQLSVAEGDPPVRGYCPTV